MTIIRSLFPSVATVITSLLLLCLTTTTLAAESNSTTTYCNCQYTNSSTEANCRVYGLLGNATDASSVLVPWYRATQECLNDYKIKISFMDTSTLIAMCPNSNGTGAVTNLIINEMKFNSLNPAVQALMKFYDEWFEEGNTADVYQLKNNITDDTGSVIDCESSSSNCWNVISQYFTKNPKDFEQICTEFHNRYRMNKELEQSTIRGRICQEISPSSTDLGVSTNCSDLAKQLNDIMATQPSDASCNRYQFGPSTRTVPTCSANGSVTPNADTSTATKGTSNAVGRFITVSWMNTAITTTTFGFFMFMIC